MCTSEKTTMIDVKDLKEVNNGNLKAIFNVILTTPDEAKITIYGLRLMENKNGGYFVGVPSKQGSDNKWYKIVNLDCITLHNIECLVLDMVNLKQPIEKTIDDDDQLPF